MDGCAKGKALLELVRRQPEEKKIVFTQFVASQEYLAGLLERNHLAYERFSGELTARQKDDAIARFRDRTPLLLSTESGGEGRNLQFCNTLINFDLPWNPMRIEQRIGRLHRIGQTRDVFIHNLSVRDTLEDQILELLESKINMFELVIGEIEPILGYISEDQEFDEIVLSLWTKSANPEELKAGFDRLGTELVAAKEQYLVARQLDRELLVEDYEV